MRMITFLLLVIATLAVGIQPAVAVSPSVNRYETSADGRFVTQTIELAKPASITASFSYCNPLSCSGPDDPLRDCHAGFWIPQFGGDLPLMLTVRPLAGGTPTKLFFKTSSSFGVPSHYGYWEPGGTNSLTEFEVGTGLGAILESPPTLHANNALSFALKHPYPADLRSAFKPGGTCGVTEEVAARYRGQTYDNFFTTRTKIAIVWKLDRPGTVTNGTQSIEVNSQPQTVPASYGQPAAVPTVTGTQLRELLTGVQPSNATIGITGQDLVNRFTEQGYQFDRQTDLGTVIARLARGEPAVAFVTILSNGQPQSGAVLMTGYNAKKDSFQVTNASTGKQSSVSYAQLMSQNPGFSFVTKGTQ